MPDNGYSELDRPMDRPFVPTNGTPLHVDAILHHVEQSIAYSRSHLSNAEQLFAQLKQALGR